MTNNSIGTCLLQWEKSCNSIDIEIIIAHILQKSRSFVIAHPEYYLTREQEYSISSLCKKRTAGYPLAYITNNKEFYGRNFYINQHTLVPRPETELFIEKVLLLIEKEKMSEILLVDIGTGSGIIAITLKKELSKKKVRTTIVASDASKEALAVAKKNAKRLDTDIMKFYHANLLQNPHLQKEILKNKYDHVIITANLPYVDIKTKNTLLQNTCSQSLQYEPQISLWSHNGGLSHYEELIIQTTKLLVHKNLQKKITSFYEIDPCQLTQLSHLCATHIPYSFYIESFCDIAKRTRLFQWSLQNNHRHNA